MSQRDTPAVPCWVDEALAECGPRTSKYEYLPALIQVAALLAKQSRLDCHAGERQGRSACNVNDPRLPNAQAGRL